MKHTRENLLITSFDYLLRSLRLYFMHLLLFNRMDCHFINIYINGFADKMETNEIGDFFLY